MEVVYYAARANLRRLMRLHPQWTQKQSAAAVGMELCWVKKWKKRLQEAEPEDEQVLHSRSRAPVHPPERISPTVTKRILQMRDEPPAGLQRTPGPKAILSSLPRDADLQGERLPRSRRTISHLLQHAGRIAPRLPHLQEELSRPAPMSRWQLDCKDATTVPPDPDGKRQHVVEVLNTVEEGPSVLVEAQVGADFRAETTDVRRWLSGSCVMGYRRRCAGTAMCASSAVRVAATSRRQRSRFCHGLGVGVLLCDAHSPQQNGFGERDHRSSQAACLAVQRPGTLHEVREVTTQCVQHSHWQRPHQGLSCGHRPPRVAFPILPELPAVPDLVDPDRWLRVTDGLHLVRLVRRDGTVRVDLRSYSVGRSWAGHHVALHLSAAKRALLVVDGHQVIKTLPLKGLSGQALRFEAFVRLMMGQARAEHRLRTLQERRARLGASASPESYDVGKQERSRGW